MKAPYYHLVQRETHKEAQHFYKSSLSMGRCRVRREVQSYEYSHQYKWKDKIKRIKIPTPNPREMNIKRQEHANKRKMAKIKMEINNRNGLASRTHGCHLTPQDLVAQGPGGLPCTDQ